MLDDTLVILEGLRGLITYHKRNDDRNSQKFSMILPIP